MVERREGRVRAERGAAAVEFAMIVPLLCFLLFAIISYGYMLSFRQALSQAAAEGARAGAVAPAGLPVVSTGGNPDSLRARALAAINQGLGSYGVSCTDGGRLVRGGQDAGDCTISQPQACASSTLNSRCVEVTLTYTYKDDSLLPTFPGLDIVLPEKLSYSTESEVS